MDNSEPIKYRIGVVLGFCITALGLFFDIFEGILSLFSAGTGGYLKDFASMLLFPAIFWFFGAPFWKGSKKHKKILTMVSGFVVALVPFLSDVLPELATSVLMTIVYTGQEDKENFFQKAEIKRNENITREKRIREKI